MRALILPAAALVLAGAVVLVGGRMVDGLTGMEPVTIDKPDAEAIAAAEAPPASPKVTANPALAEETAVERSPARIEAPPLLEMTPTPFPGAETPPTAPEVSAAQSPAAADAQPSPPKPLATSRLVAPTVIAPPELAAGEELLREAPRDPLSKLSLALPPVPELKNKWAGTPFFRPLAIESAVFESMGRTIAVAGVESVRLGESCNYEGVSWPCGVRARTAFRLWLRGRALICQLPDEEHEVTRARCRLAKQDAGAWLVSNGWARAAPDGPYVVAEEKARAGKLGIFGSPPDTSSISDVPDAPVGTTAGTQPIMTEEGVDPQPSLAPQGELPPQLQFPPAPPSPD
jgi:endonuclease YncB( thermonuclease family)